MRIGAMRVLMVEDDVKMAGLVRRGLEEDGHAADMASRGEDAVGWPRLIRTTRSSPGPRR